MVITATAGYYSRQVCWNTSAVRYALHNVDSRTIHLQKTRDSASGKEKEYREISQSWRCSMKNVPLSANVETKLDKHCSLASWVDGPPNMWHYKIPKM